LRESIEAWFIRGLEGEVHASIETRIERDAAGHA
jgi:hypothetical protein